MPCPSKNFRQLKIFRKTWSLCCLWKASELLATDTLYGLKNFFILKISTKFTNFWNKIFVIFSNEWPPKNFWQPKFFRNQLKPTFFPKSLMIYGTDTLYGLKIWRWGLSARLRAIGPGTFNWDNYLDLRHKFGYCLHTETTKDVFDDNIYLKGTKILKNNSIDSL